MFVDSVLQLHGQKLRFLSHDHLSSTISGVGKERLKTKEGFPGKLVVSSPGGQTLVAITPLTIRTKHSVERERETHLDT